MFSPCPYFVEAISVCQNCIGNHTLSTKLSTNILTGIITLPCPTENLHWSSQVWSKIAIGLKKEAVWTIPAKRKYPLGEGFKQVVALTAFKGCTRVRDALPASPFLCPATQLNQCVGCRRSMVMKPKLWIYCVPTCRLDTKRHHACAQRGTLSETFRYASPRMATAQRQYVYVSVST